MIADSVQQVYECLTRAEIKIVESGVRNDVGFGNSKDKMITITKGWKPDQKQRLAQARIKVKGKTFGFNPELSRWLEVYLNSGLQLWVLKNLLLEKAGKC